MFLVSFCDSMVDKGVIWNLDHVWYGFFLMASSPCLELGRSRDHEITSLQWAYLRNEL